MNNPSAAAQTADIGLSYDEMPYESYCFRTTHPDYLYMMGALFGLAPPDFRTAQVLELGCALGGNLFPFAHKFPQARCTGIDLSAAQIDAAKEIQKKLGIANIDFLQKDIMEIDPGFGTFDYIIAHGVFSWVPDDVRGQILRICRDNLSESGIAFVSYNTYPGWHFVMPVRDLIQYHTAALADPSEKVTKAREILEFMAGNVKEDQKALKNYLAQEHTIVSTRNDSYVYHEFMEAMNRPFYFHEFHTMLEDSGLQYLGDADLATMYVKNAGDAAAQTLAAMKDPVRQEQYLDFLTGCRFRKSLVVRQSAAIDRQIKPERIFDFYLTARVTPERPARDLNGVFTFRKKEGQGSFRTNRPAASALFLALCDLGEAPSTVDEIAARAKEKFGFDAPDQIRQAAVALGFEYAMRGFIQLHMCPATFVAEAGDRPEVYRVARGEAGLADDCRMVTSAARSTVPIQDSFFSRLMVYCDGTRDIAALTDAMTAEAKAGRVVIRGDNGMPLPEGQYTKDNIDLMVRMALRMFGNVALLVG